MCAKAVAFKRREMREKQLNSKPQSYEYYMFKITKTCFMFSGLSEVLNDVFSKYFCSHVTVSKRQDFCVRGSWSVHVIHHKGNRVFHLSFF